MADESQPTQTSESVTLSRKVAERLFRTAMVEELKTDLQDWARKRAWTAIVTISIVGLVGIQAILTLIISGKN